MNIKITSKDGVTLKTANKYVEKDIAIVLDESFVQPSGTLEITEKGEYDVKEIEKVNVNIETGSSGTDMLQARVDVAGCKSLFNDYTGTNVDFISGLDTSRATDMTKMFYNCYSLTTVPQINTNSAENMTSMYYYCQKLTVIDITHYNIGATFKISYFAYMCSALKALIIRSFGANYVLNTNSLNVSGIANGTGYIYVPRDMVDTLKSATNWSTYASQIRALEDYTVDGTTTGALDESKI